MASTLAFLRAHARPAGAAVDVHTVAYARGGESLPADLYLPHNTRRRLPGYVLLHGLTCTARAHVSLQRFARALAASGHVVLVPEIPEWRALHVAPAITIETIRAAVRALHERAEIDPERIGLFGFSFGATQALVAAADPDVARLMRGLVAWGGYCDLERLFRFGLTGEHELDGVGYVMDPDPYGRWIMLGNYLTRVPGHEHDGAVAAAAHELARIAGERAIPSYDAALDPVKAEIRARLSSAQRALFDRMAPPANQPAQGTPENRALGTALAVAALAADPLLDPRPFLCDIRVRTILAHGRDDRLVPFTETTRLARAMPPQVLAATAITALFAHSGGAQHGLGPVGLAREATRFVRMMQRLLNLL
jgi:acetyl esterase/lipase